MAMKTVKSLRPQNTSPSLRCKKQAQDASPARPKPKHKSQKMHSSLLHNALMWLDLAGLLEDTNSRAKRWMHDVTQNHMQRFVKTWLKNTRIECTHSMCTLVTNDNSSSKYVGMIQEESTQVLEGMATMQHRDRFSDSDDSDE